ncbi:MAG: penicillin-binding protein 2 [Bacillota bacterium]|nr:penicillin-binding protein 2 [Bacillota bacterium]
MALVICLALVFTFLGGRLAYLQIAQGGTYSKLSEGNRIRLIPLPAPRGVIYDRNGKPVVTARPAYSVSLVVMDRQAARKSAAKVAEMLGLDPQEVLSRIDKNAGRLYEPIRIASDISPEIHTLIEEAKADLPGIVVSVEPVREYLYGSTASHVVGYTGEIRDSQLAEPKYAGYKMGDIIGQAGIEAQYDSMIRGKDGGKQVEVDHKGRPTPRDLGMIGPEPGNDIVLSLDIDLQQAVEKALADQLLYLQANGFPNAKAASMVMLDPRTGEVLAMASLPAYDSNEFVKGMSVKRFAELLKNPLRPFNNRSISGVYAPGSTFKMVTAIAALEEGKVSPYELFSDPGYHPVVPSLACHAKGGHGAVNLETAIRVSCNVYFYEMGRRLGIDRMAKWGNRLGLGVRPGIDISGESQGLMPTTQWKREAYEKRNPPWIREPEFLLAEDMMSGMGQGYHGYTPLQMANYVATIANGGKRYQPHFLKETQDSKTQAVQENKPVVAEELGASQSTLEIIRRAMASVCQPGGTAGLQFLGFPVEVCGKTGTAENPQGDDHAWFVGYAPYRNPEVAFAVLIEQGGHGGTGAAPVARKVLEHYFGLEPVEKPGETGGHTTP